MLRYPCNRGKKGSKSVQKYLASLVYSSKLQYNRKFYWNSSLSWSIRENPEDFRKWFRPFHLVCTSILREWWSSKRCSFEKEKYSNRISEIIKTEREVKMKSLLFLKCRSIPTTFRCFCCALYIYWHFKDARQQARQNCAFRLESFIHRRNQILHFWWPWEDGAVGRDYFSSCERLRAAWSLRSRRRSQVQKRSAENIVGGYWKDYG
jgi:hypothetical protein